MKKYSTWAMAADVVIALSEKEAKDFAIWLEALSNSEKLPKPKSQKSKDLMEQVFSLGWVLINASDCAKQIRFLLEFKNQLSNQ